MSQQPLFDPPPGFRTRVLARRKDFDALFEGFTRMRAITYVATPDLVLEFLDARGYVHVELLVGDSLSSPAEKSSAWRQEMAQKDTTLTERLAEKVESGALSILVPERIVHTKLYLLDGAGRTRIVMTSANLTESARRVKQVNYAWVADVPAGDPFLEQVTRDFAAHCKDAVPFMGDLVELLRSRSDTPRREIIEAWLKGAAGESQDGEIRRVLQELSVTAIQLPEGKDESLITVQLPELPVAQRQAERALGDVGQRAGPGEFRVGRLAWLRYVEETHGLPVLRLDQARQHLVLGVNGTRVVLTEPPPGPEALNAALQHIEDYFATVDDAQTQDLVYAKTAMYEALLHVFFSPFASEYMQRKRAAYGSVDSRGPRILYVFGPSQNGKSTFLRFALKLLAGRQYQPLAGNHFTKARLSAAAQVGTAFPLVFDDVVGLQGTPNIEEAIKSYWEVWWRPEFVQPAVIISSNIRALKPWAKSRVKRVDFDVHFAPSERGKERLAKLFAAENPLFKWFSDAYVRLLHAGGNMSDDELHLARAAMLELYERAGRPVPAYFPREPLERLYDPGRRDWNDLLYGLRKARLVRDGGRTRVDFSEDMPHWEVNEYESHLPQTVKARRRGNTLVIESPAEFDAWLAAGRPRRKSWLLRLLRR